MVVTLERAVCPPEMINAMQQGQIKYGGEPLGPRINEDSFYPNIDNTYTVRSYVGDRLCIRTNSQSYGIKGWASLPSNKQGMAIYGNKLFRMSATSSSTTHYVYKINDNNTVQEVGSFTCSTSEHSNSLQFAPLVEGNNDYPYLYIANLNGVCTVLSIASDYTATQVQQITVPYGSQVHIGDDGHIYSWTLNSAAQFRIFKYRKVLVSEGSSITLTASDLVEEFNSEDAFPTAYYTFQGWKVRFGKVWFIIGTDGNDKKRALYVYDLAAKRTAANIDLTWINKEFEDLDFWDNALIIACYESNTYIMRF